MMWLWLALAAVVILYVVKAMPPSSGAGWNFGWPLAWWTVAMAPASAVPGEGIAQRSGAPITPAEREMLARGR